MRHWFVQSHLLFILNFSFFSVPISFPIQQAGFETISEGRSNRSKPKMSEKKKMKGNSTAGLTS